MRRLSCVVGALVLMMGPARASESGWQTASDIGAYSLITASIALPTLNKDRAGAFQALGSFAGTSLVTEGLKQAFPKTRPDGSDRKSFPSGHSSRSFAAAATLFNREGAKVGIPAFAVASFVAVARVEGKKHYWTDVLAGAGIGTAIGFAVTRDRPARTQTAFMPWADLSGGGFSFAAAF